MLRIVVHGIQEHKQQLSWRSEANTYKAVRVLRDRNVIYFTLKCLFIITGPWWPHVECRRSPDPRCNASDRWKDPDGTPANHLGSISERTLAVVTFIFVTYNRAVFRFMFTLFHITHTLEIKFITSWRSLLGSGRAQKKKSTGEGKFYFHENVKFGYEASWINTATDLFTTLLWSWSHGLNW